MKTTWLCISFAFLLSSCDLGPLSRPTATAVATTTSTATATSTSTQTATAAPSSTPLPTQTFTPTAVTCPKGTVLLPSVNRCFFATRTQRPPEPTFCQHFKYKWACINNDCFWDRTVQLCK